jgi:hypothetical protein
MNMLLRHASAAAGIVLIASSFAPRAQACTVDRWRNPTAGGWLQHQALDVSYTSLSGGASGEFAADRSIVGLWKFTFAAKGVPGIPDGAVIDAGYATWHSDGTEIMNSSRPPQSSSFCMGVWKRVGRTYRLNHFALSWDPTGTTFVGPANIRESVTVDRTGNRYSGTFTIDQFAEDGTTVLKHLTGTVEATRVTAD